MTEAEERLLRTLVGMCQQYLQTRDGGLDHEWMSAGEHAVELLAEYKLVEPSGRGGDWTPAGLALLASPDVPRRRR